MVFGVFCGRTATRDALEESGLPGEAEEVTGLRPVACGHTTLLDHPKRIALTDLAASRTSLAFSNVTMPVNETKWPRSTRFSQIETPPLVLFFLVSMHCYIA